MRPPPPPPRRARLGRSTHLRATLPPLFPFRSAAFTPGPRDDTISAFAEERRRAEEAHQGVMLPPAPVACFPPSPAASLLPLLSPVAPSCSLPPPRHRSAVPPLLLIFLLPAASSPPLHSLLLPGSAFPSIRLFGRLCRSSCSCSGRSGRPGAPRPERSGRPGRSGTSRRLLGCRRPQSRQS